MGKVDLIVACSESVRESEGVVASVKSVTFTLEAVLKVAYIASNSVPAKLLGPIARLL